MKKGKVIALGFAPPFLLNPAIGKACRAAETGVPQDLATSY
jgi:hypothetical protein